MNLPFVANSQIKVMCFAADGTALDKHCGTCVFAPHSTTHIPPSVLLLVQARPCALHIHTPVVPKLDTAQACEWLDAVAPDLQSPESHMIGHDVWAKLARYYQQQNRLPEAEAIFLRGLAAGYPDALEYERSLPDYHKITFRDSIVMAPSEKHNGVLALVLLACDLR